MTVPVKEQIIIPLCYVCSSHILSTGKKRVFLSVFHAVFLERIILQAVSKRSSYLEQKRIKQAEELCIIIAQQP